MVTPGLAAIAVAAMNARCETAAARRPDWPDGAGGLDAVEEFLNQSSATDGGPEQENP